MYDTKQKAELEIARIEPRDLERTSHAPLRRGRADRKRTRTENRAPRSLRHRAAVALLSATMAIARGWVHKKSNGWTWRVMGLWNPRYFILRVQAWPVAGCVRSYGI